MEQKKGPQPGSAAQRRARLSLRNPDEVPEARVAKRTRRRQAANRAAQRFLDEYDKAADDADALDLPGCAEGVHDLHEASPGIMACTGCPVTYHLVDPDSGDAVEAAETRTKEQGWTEGYVWDKLRKLFVKDKDTDINTLFNCDGNHKEPKCADAECWLRPNDSQK